MAPFIVWKHQNVFRPIYIMKVSNTPLGNFFSYITFIYVHKIQYRHNPVVYNIMTFFNDMFFQL